MSVGTSAARLRRLALFVAVAAVVAAIDQLSKVAVVSSLTPGQAVTFIPHVMDLLLTFNVGAAFSLGQGAGPLFVCVAAILALGGAWLVWSRPELPLHLVVVGACVAGGGVGNAIDRVIRGSVVDFFATTFVDFAVFNVADIFVTCGIPLLFVLWLRYDAQRSASDGVASASTTSTKKCEQ